MVRNSSSRFLDVFGSSSSTTTTYTTTTTTSHGLVPPYVSHPALLEHNSKSIHHISPLSLGPGRSQLQQSTRVQLQRQRLREHAASALVSSTIPGFKTSAAFFASPRTNLRLSTSPPPSPMSTPPSMTASASSLPPPSPLAQAVDDAPADPLAGVPELSSYQATTDEDQTAALKLVADSVAQMRQTSNRILIWHPVNLGALVAAMAVMIRVMQSTGKDWIAIGMATMGVTMIYFTAFRLFTQGYIAAAEALNFAWAGESDILVTKFGDEIIGALFVEFVSVDSRQKRKKALRGEIRGWTVRKKYRNKGVGTALLEDAVRLAREKGAESLELADDHANSVQVLHGFYGGYFVKQERKQRAKIQEAFDNSSRSRRK